MTPERERYHSLLREFASEIPRGALVYDIGKCTGHDYRIIFSKQQYRTIDRSKHRRPDVLLDVESSSFAGPSGLALLCNGVTETCNDPCSLIAGSRRLLQQGARALFGVMSIAYPIGSRSDFWRLTPKGALRLLERSGFAELHLDAVERNGIPSYLFIHGSAQ